MILSIAVSIVLILMVVLAIRAIIVAFLKRKDERMKMIVIKSMSHAFCVLLALQVFQMLLKFAIGLETYYILSNSFMVGIYIEPAIFSMMILGVTLLINQKRFS